MLAHVSKTECGSMDLSVGDNAFGECATVEGFPPARRDHLKRCGMSPGAEQFPRTRCATAGQKAFGEARLVLQFLTAECPQASDRRRDEERSEEHTSELQSLMRLSYAVFCLKKKNTRTTTKSVCY